MRTHGTALGTLMLLATAAGAARAEGDDHMKLSRGLPITLDDAVPIEAGSRAVKLRFAYERQDERNRYLPDAELEIGVARGWAVKLEPRYAFGNASGTGRGAFNLSVEHNVLELSGTRPGITIEPGVTFPFGSGSDAVEAQIELRATQPLGSGPGAPRLHLNIAWLHLFDRESDERANRYSAAAGINLPVAAATAVAFNVVHEQSREKGKRETYLEAGVRHAFDDKTALAAGAGFGLGPDSADFRLLVGLQRSF
ncbi:hypothetical protein [Azospirillum sp.]|uniref:hypothetical protein n=1 Tax=Azospirillum sp. TaxID=34012 RepID=UPI002D5FC57F|nr:hypothetical protein [Azospirillum sp.]HYD69999.1 hypothetical protein [Azospirillum sp.]